MDLNELHVFATVAQEKSFSRAAERLFRTQPAISMSIRKLEQWAGEPLFVRGSRATRLTDAGELLLSYAERMLNMREQAQRGLGDLRGLGSGRLSLGVNESSIHALLPLFARYRKLHPSVKISVARTSSQDVPAALLNFKIDLGVISYVPQEPKLVAIPFFKDRLTLVVNPKHRLAKRHNVNISELSREIFIAHIVDSEHRWKVIQLFEKNRVTLNRDVEMPTIESIKRFVEMGMGVAIVPEMCVRHEVAEGLLSELKIKQLNIPRRLYIVHRRNDPPSHAAEALLELIRGRQSKIATKTGADIEVLRYIFPMLIHKILFTSLLLLVSPAAAPHHVSFPTSDGGVVYADVYGSGERGVVLAHGGQFNKESWEKQAQVLVDAGFRVLAFDFRGFGQSRGPKSKSRGDGVEYDVLASVRYMHRTGTKTVSVVGASFGGGAAADASIIAEPGEIDRLVLLAGWTENPPEKIKGRKLFIVARDDSDGGGDFRLPHIRANYEKALDPKELIILDGSAHAQFLFATDQGGRLMHEILRFLTQP